MQSGAPLTERPAFHNIPPGHSAPDRNGFGVRSTLVVALKRYPFGLSEAIFFNMRPEKTEMTSVSKLTSEQVSIIKARLRRGDFQHRIAADYDLNQGRISEIATGKRFANVPPASDGGVHV